MALDHVERIADAVASEELGLSDIAFDLNRIATALERLVELLEPVIQVSEGNPYGKSHLRVRDIDRH